MKVSVVMAYVDRIDQLRYTLQRMQTHNFDGEIVISDDFSSAEHNPKKLISEFPNLNIRVVYPNKKYSNPCIAYNKAIAESTGDIVIIQNPECCWSSDISSYAKVYFADGQRKKYLSFACLSVNEQATKTLWNLSKSPNSVKGVWYNHSLFRPTGYHFCAALLKSDLNDFLLGGFDPRFSDGCDFDDLDFVLRVHRENFDIKITNDPFVVHQFHQKVWMKPNYLSLHNVNKGILESTHFPISALPRFYIELN